MKPNLQKDLIKNKLDSVGITYKDTGTDWLLTQCINPAHKDETPSMFLNVSGYGKCASCDYIVTRDFFIKDDSDVDVFLNASMLKVLDMLNTKLLEEEEKEFFLPPFSKLAVNYRGLPDDAHYHCDVGRYAGRIIFPFYDLNNKLRGYTGRVYDKTKAVHPEVKYLHSTGIKTNEHVLYGHKIKDLPKDRGLVLVEGHMDALALIAQGIPATPLLGFKKPTDSFILDVIKLGFDSIIIALDNDEVGIAKMIGEHNITKEWRKEYKTELGFYCDYQEVKALYRSKMKDHHEVYELLNKATHANKHSGTTN